MPEISMLQYKDDPSEFMMELQSLITGKMTEKGWKESGFGFFPDSKRDSKGNYVERILGYEKKSLFSKKMFRIECSLIEVKWGYNVRKKRYGRYEYDFLYDEPTPEFDDVFDCVRDFIKGKELERLKMNQDEVDSLKRAFSSKVSSTYFVDVIRTNQSKMDPSLIIKLLRLQEYYNSKIDEYNEDHDELCSDGFHMLKNKKVLNTRSYLERGMRTINDFEAGMKEMIDAYAISDLVTFYSIYNKYDKLGIMADGNEKTMLANLQHMNSDNQRMLSHTSDMERTLSKLRDELNGNY